jgi:hypothetical protein
MNSTDESPIWEATSRLAGQEFPSPLPCMKTEDSLPRLEKPTILKIQFYYGTGDLSRLHAFYADFSYLTNLTLGCIFVYCI